MCQLGVLNEYNCLTVSEGRIHNACDSALAPPAFLDVAASPEVRLDAGIGFW